MSRQISIASVTVAYNGADVLPRQLDALRQQTRKLDQIIVVDNASSDDTLKILERYPEVRVLNRGENAGVGGGFAFGLEYAAHERKHDWVWLLDQDSIPARDALERLIDGLRDSREHAHTAILAPVCMNSKAQVSYSASLWRNGLRRSPNPTNSDRILFVDSVISSGTLLRREAVEEVGLPRADFFMDFVDHEYCLRLRRYGYNIALVADSRLEHALGETSRTNFFGLARSWSRHAPWREYYMTRNEIFTIWKYFPGWKAKLVTGKRLLRHAFGVVLFGRKKLASLAMMCRGVADGRAGRLGIRHFER